MAKFTIKANSEDIEKAGQDLGEFEVPKPGFYHVKIVEANAGYSKTDGEEDKNKPRIEVVYEIVGEGMEAKEPGANYGRIWDYITFGDGYAATRRTEFAMALGATKEEVESGVDFDTDEMLERVIIARLKHEKDKRKSEEEKKVVNRARVATVMALDAADGYQEAAFSEDAFAGDGEDDGDGDAFADDVEDEGGEESDLLTQEELEGYDLKELGNVAKEFDLDPKESLVKFKSGEKKGKTNASATKKALIEAILEAQNGVEDEGEDDGDEDADDDPF